MTGLEKSLSSSLTTAAVSLVVAGLYLLVVGLRGKVSWSEAWQRTGLVPGSARWWWLALGILLPWLGYVKLTYGWAPVTAADTSSPYRVLLGQGLNPPVILAAFTYGLVASGLGEELLFRGLIAGALGRRMRLWKANLAQAAIFLAPHCLILLVKPDLWFLLPVGVFGLALITGWLRLRSGSIGPGIIVHGVGNALVGLLAATSNAPD